MLTGKMKEVTTQTEVQTSCIATQVAQQLEKKLEAVVTSTAVTPEQKTRVAVEDVCRNVQAQVEQIRVDA